MAIFYNSLNKDRNEIRVVRFIHNNHLNRVIEVELVTVSLDDKSDYYYLSYVWGPQSRSRLS